MSTQVYAGTLHVLNCARCGITFGIEASFEDRRRKDHARFYCPEGHTNYYNHETDEEKARASALRHRKRADRFEVELGDMRAAMPWEQKQAVERAKGYSDNRAFLGAFWKGFEARNCGELVGCCPYKKGKAAAFRRAWRDGFRRVS